MRYVSFLDQGPHYNVKLPKTPRFPPANDAFPKQPKKRYYGTCSAHIANKARAAPNNAPWGTKCKDEAAPVNSAGEDGRIAPVPVPTGAVLVPSVEGIG